LSNRNRARGMSLIEVVIFIVVLGIGIAGTVALFNQLTRSSVDPMVRKQALAIASSLLEEIELKSFTYCDPDDPAVYTAASTAGCATVQGIVPTAGETRYSGTTRYDNVGDYGGFCMGPGAPACTDVVIRTADGTNLAALANYRVAVTIAAISGGAELPAVADVNDALRITVTVTHPTGVTVSLQGYRLRYAPNSP